MTDLTPTIRMEHAGGGGPLRKIAVGTGAEIDIETGAALKVAGVDKTAALAAIPPEGMVGVGTGYKLARGEAALDGSNPTSVAHGLTTCVAVVATLKGSAAPGVGTSHITAVINGAAVDFYAWKPTSNADPTLIASTGTESFYWIAVGT